MGPSQGSRAAFRGGCGSALPAVGDESFREADAQRSVSDVIVPGEVASALNLRASRLRRRVFHASRILYQKMENSRFSVVLATPLVKWLKTRITQMPADEVCAVLDWLDAVGITALVVGGWGVDALVGVQTRAHHDLDVVVAADGRAPQAAAARLGALGYFMVRERMDGGQIMPIRRIFADDVGHTIDLLPVDLTSHPFAPSKHPRDEPFVRGTIGHRWVRCASGPLQRKLHSGYRLRPIDDHDLGNLGGAREPTVQKLHDEQRS